MEPRTLISHSQRDLANRPRHRSHNHHRRSPFVGGRETRGQVAPGRRATSSHAAEVRDSSRNNEGRDRGACGYRREQDDSYVWSWLEQTQARVPRSAVEVDEAPDANRTSLDAAHTWRPHGLPINDIAAARMSRPAAHGRSIIRKRRVASEDSSVISETLYSPAGLPARNETHAVRRSSTTRSSPYYGSGKKRAMTCSSSISALADGPREGRTRFEKRARYKTREDKYEPGRRDRTRHEAVGDDPKPKRRDRHGEHKKRKLISTSSKNVMRNFSSTAILNERLTVSRAVHPIPMQS